MTKGRLFEVELARGASILSVILIHSTSGAMSELVVSSPEYQLYYLVNRLACFAVPAFVLLSGVVLFYKYSGDWTFSNSGSFYKRRVQSIVIPYIVWAVWYYWLFQLAGDTGSSASIPDLFQQIASGKTAYHLYFAVLMVQLYVLTPFLLSIAKTGRGKLGFLLIGSIIIQAAATFLNERHGWLEDRSFLFSTYFASFVLGCCVGQQYEKTVRWIRSRAATLYIAFVPLAALCAFVRLNELNDWIIMDALLHELIVHSYSIGAALCLLTLFLNWNRHCFAARVLSAAGICSFGVYLLHPTIMYYLEKLLVRSGIDLFHLNVLLQFTVASAASLAIVYAVRKWKRSWILFGK